MPHHFKKFIGRAALGAALLMTGLQAGAASALSFNFSFSGLGLPSRKATVTGIVDGLVDNLADQTTGLTFTITSATNTSTLGWSTFSNFVSGQGIDVFGGQVTGADVFYNNNFEAGQLLFLGNQNGFPSELSSPSIVDNFFYINYHPDSSPANSLRFTPVTPASPASVPGPLPLFGVGAAFAWSRRLRCRIKSPA